MKKPWKSERAAGWHDPDAVSISPALRAELIGILRHRPRSKWPPEQVERFVAACNSAVNNVLLFDDDSSPGVARDALQDVVKKAQDLLKALAALSESAADAVECTYQELVHATAPAVLLSDRCRAAPRGRLVVRRGARSRLDVAWDTVDDLHQVAGLCAGRFDGFVSQGNKVSVTRAKRLIWFVAHAHYAITGALPPRSKESWFPVFMEKLAECESLRLKTDVRLACGAALVCKVVSEMDPTHC
ncbi:hypothetical protein CATMQ487_14910 [Sphaerotilus microaerophilus]|jgi:hypothetical protein|uniref:Uncharacterized protein n=1 Tax=Sphaerotilus microaerophilus TaxID=2914710 RepID=A0ABN6PHP5_9BURK|nr:hypothetical protein CATMQ487_14910 [Sphaerotilus sp. FB-5]